MTYKSFFFLCCKWTSEDGNLIAIKLHASETCFHDLQYTCPSNKSLKLKAINIMLNQLNMKKHQASGARKTVACPLLRALEKCRSICNFLETTWARGLRQAREHSSNGTRPQSLGLYSGEALFGFIFLAEKKVCCLVLFYPKYLLAVAPPTFSTREEHTEKNAVATSCYNILFIGLFNLFPWALVTLPES